MSNIAIFNPGAMRPAFAQQGAISAAAKALAGSGGSGKRLSIKGGVFRLMVDGKEVTAIDERYLDVVIVNAAPKVTRTWYEGTYVEGQAAKPPACWSPDGDKPDPAVRQPQSLVCATCPKNQKGSGQGDSKACRYSQQTAVVLANDIEGHVMQLSLPAASIFGKAEGDNRPLQDYVRYMLAQGVDVTQLITRLKFDTAAATPKLFFKAMRWLEEDEYAICQQQGLSADALKAITMTVSQMDGVAPQAAAPAPFQAPAKAAPAPLPPEDDEPPAPPPRTRAAAPEAEPPAPAPKPRKPRTAAAPLPPEAEPEPTPEPTVRATAPQPAARVPSTTSLAQTLSDWDDE